ncbi:MAG TPA: hypothetical protein VNL91_03870 [Thermoanaerobaculia bacterium]|nr:hypothetical protein [Thermoanaerobaculia bacterium]
MKFQKPLFYDESDELKHVPPAKRKAQRGKIHVTVARVIDGEPMIVCITTDDLHSADRLAREVTVAMKMG